MSDPSTSAVFPFAANLAAGRAALVTRGGSGVGRVIAEQLAHRGLRMSSPASSYVNDGRNEALFDRQLGKSEGR